jgi:hypothetical protein
MTVFIRHQSTLPNEWNGSCNGLIGEWKKGGDTSIQLRRVTVRASGYRLLRPWYRLFHLG